MEKSHKESPGNHTDQNVAKNETKPNKKELSDRSPIHIRNKRDARKDDNNDKKPRIKKAANSESHKTSDKLYKKEKKAELVALCSAEK